MSKPVKTINQRYTKKQRKEIAKQLREHPRLTLIPWKNLLGSQARRYVEKVLLSYGEQYFFSFALRRGRDIDFYPNGSSIGYIHDALNRLADELDPPKEQSK